MLLASEMVAFCIFVAPLPFKVRRKLFRFLSENSIVAKIAYGLKISFMYETIIPHPFHSNSPLQTKLDLSRSCSWMRFSACFVSLRRSKLPRLVDRGYRMYAQRPQSLRANSSSCSASLVIPNVLTAPQAPSATCTSQDSAFSSRLSSPERSISSRILFTFKMNTLS